MTPAERIEVLRGPSTLLYGSSAIGGAVNVIDHAIPESAPARPFGGAVELRAGGAARETAGVLSVGGGGPRLATQARAVLEYCLAHDWVTLRALADACGAPEASVSARLRDLRRAGDD